MKNSYLDTLERMICLSKSSNSCMLFFEFLCRSANNGLQYFAPEPFESGDDDFIQLYFPEVHLPFMVKLIAYIHTNEK